MAQIITRAIYNDKRETLYRIGGRIHVLVAERREDNTWDDEAERKAVLAIQEKAKCRACGGPADNLDCAVCARCRPLDSLLRIRLRHKEFALYLYELLRDVNEARKDKDKWRLSNQPSECRGSNCPLGDTAEETGPIVRRARQDTLFTHENEL